MQAPDFIRKWGDSELRERQGAQEHFIDLCALLGEPTPAEDDPKGDHYCFERGAEKVGGGDGWADVWRKGCFGWEYKGKHKDLGAALRQLQAYALDLQNPPYLVVSDMERIVVHTNWTNTVSETHTITLDDLHEPAKRDFLKAVFRGSDRLKPRISPQELTAKVAQRFGQLGLRLQERGKPPRAVAHFLNRLVFCMFAEDARLLPDELFTRVVRVARQRPARAAEQIAGLFAVMAQRDGGFFGADPVRWFNGGLFDDATVLPLTAQDLELIYDTAREHDWSEIDPAIFGTLFEQALTATRERPALGAHYTDRDKILKIVEPVISRPLAAEWDIALADIRVAMDEAAAAEAQRKLVQERGAEALQQDPAAARAGEAGRRRQLAAIGRARTVALNKARARLETFLTRLAAFRVLDPACGSGNFLYVALHALRDLELRAIVDAERLDVPDLPAPRVGLAAVKGIEIEAYAAELARVTLWIGDLQWMRKNGYTQWAEPILSSLDQIECRDALLNPDGSEAEWPGADVIIGNPPFLGGKRLRDGLGDARVEALFATFRGRVPAEADLVCYWVRKAWEAVRLGDAWGPEGRFVWNGLAGLMIDDSEAEGEPFDLSGLMGDDTAPAARLGADRAGLVTTNSIRGGANRRVLDPIVEGGRLWEAWADEPWIVDGAAVRVSMIGFGNGFVERRLEGLPAPRINPDLTGSAVDLTRAARLTENAGVAFMGDTKGGAFDIPGELAREWLRLPLNPNGRPNSDVLKPWRNAMDVTRRPADKWIIDFGWTMSEAEAALYEAPFRQLLLHVQPVRAHNNRADYRERWWRHVEPRPGMWRALSVSSRFAAVPRVAKHRLVVWLSGIEPDSQLIVIGRGDD